MKKLCYSIFGLIVIIGALTSCTVEGVGPAGRDGIDGLDGIDGQEAYVFEYNIDFVAPEYREILLLPDDFEMLDSDVVLTYVLWEVVEGDEIWRLVPQNVFMSEGILQYNYDFTRTDVSIFLGADFPLSFVPANYLNNWIVRVVVVPGQFEGARKSVVKPDYKDFDAVASFYGLDDKKHDLKNFSRDEMSDK